jgi:hypothetical protein
MMMAVTVSFVIHLILMMIMTKVEISLQLTTSVNNCKGQVTITMVQSPSILVFRGA